MEFTVNKELEDHINAPLPSTGVGRVALEIDDENEVESDEDNGEVPLSHVTRDAIYAQLAGAKHDDPYIDPKKILSVKAMSEGEGKSYLELLRAQRSVTFSRSVSRKLVNGVTSRLCHPRDECTPLLAETDASMIDELSVSLGWVFSHLGGVKGYVMLGIYIASSWMKNWDDQVVQWNEKKHLETITGRDGGQEGSTTTTTSTGQKTHNVNTPVQGNGGKSESNG